ncbi:PPC domain-containing protein [Neorhodopirellula pilleata]|uniref:Peptidase C-terminal archaeal/bacterial domain-containing protein n=1 Tax=Neorhodopirellula pilleata TaxID=2714738 RepID=A0A5C6ABD2_9BACT|nr:PPC domain-containing protein [Neorhodopirellula pilleata]TWT96361.1 hypothetical protein Pla100_28390 [Neorhodopirellula pilleata]
MKSQRIQRLLGFSVIFVSVCFSVGDAQAAFPKVVYHQPLGVTRGGEATIKLVGEQLGDAREILFDVPGVEVLEVKAIDEKSVEIKVKTPADLDPGQYPYRLVTDSGVANLRFLSVGTMPIIDEVEPNNDFAAPQLVKMDHTIEGNIDREDVDYFQVDLKAGQKLTVEIEGTRHRSDLQNRDTLDPFIAILNDKRFEVAVSDDSTLFQQDGVCSFTPQEDGKYIVLVRDSSFGGNRDHCRYRLHVGSFPRPTTIIPSGGVQGDVFKASVIDIDGTVSEATLQLPTDLIDPNSSNAERTQPWPVVTANASGVSPTPNYIRVGNLPIVNEVEPNDNYREPPKCSVPALLCGVLREPNDYDCFGFDCKKGESFRIQLFARETLRSPLDGVVNVFGPDGKTIKSGDDMGGKLDCYFTFSAAVDGTHTIRVYDHLREGSPLHNYAIEVTRQKPSFSLALQELRRDEAVVMPIPVGGQSAMVVTASRDGFNEEIQLTLDALPPGVTATTYPIPSGRVEIPVVLTATADAKYGASLFDIVGVGKLGDQAVNGELLQYHKILLGQNQRAMRDHYTDRAAAAVCEKMPFEVELVQPKTPILRRGSKELLVRIKRDEGFDNPVYFKTLYNPPGIAVNNSRKIDKGQNEVTIPMTANGSAATGQWPIIMQVSYGTNRSTATFSTQPIMLDVEEPVFNFSFPRSAAETGQELQLVIGMEKLRDITGEIEVELVGIPNGVTCPEATKKVTLGDTAVTFPLVIAADAKTGTHKTMVVQTRITRDGETFLQTDGTGEIRIDKPLPKKEVTAEPKKVEPKPETKAAPKPLSRLEQLRQQKEAP